MTRELPLMIGGDGGSEMTPKNWTLEGKNRTLGEIGGQKSSDIINGRSLMCFFLVVL